VFLGNNKRISVKCAFGELSKNTGEVQIKITDSAFFLLLFMIISFDFAYYTNRSIIFIISVSE
jgi:hypothetical protein